MSPKRKINPTKISSKQVQTSQPTKSESVSEYSGLQDMQREMTAFFLLLRESNNKFKVENAFHSLNQYISTYKRILYSTISFIVYDITNQDRSENSKTDRDQYGTLLSNIDTLLEYSDSVTKMDALKAATPNEQAKRNIDDTRKAVWKIWDHVNLARRQYDDLKQSDAEFKRRFNEQIRESKESMTKEMNSQLLTIVGIFTALAFVLFGGISSLQGILEGLQETHLLKLLILSCGWVLGMLNVLFVFLFCIGKMTKQNFKSTMSPNATFWQRYPVVCWTDFLFSALLLILSWLYYCTNRNGHEWLNEFFQLHPVPVTIIGFVLIAILIGIVFWRLCVETKAILGDEDE